MDNEYSKFISAALDRQKGARERWEEVDSLYDGNYSPLIGGLDDGSVPYVKTYMLAGAVETQIAITMPPPNVQFVVEPANKEQDPDINSAKTAKALGDYFMNHNGGYEKIEDACSDYFLTNRCILKVGYRPRGKEKKSKKTINKQVFYTEGDNGKGQPYFDKVARKDFVISDGFKTIRDAEVSGGRVAYRVYPHISWVKDNPSFKEYMGKDLENYTATLKHPHQKIDIHDPYLEHETEDELSYVRLWYIYTYPTAEYEDGKMAVYDADQDILLYEVENFREYEGLDFPFFEAVDTVPREGYYAVSKASRARNAQLKTEYFETKHLELTRYSKNVLVVPEDSKDETESEIRDSDQALAVIKSEELKPQEGIYNFQITYDLEAVERGALRSRGQFQEIIGPNFSDPRSTDKIATEMVFQNRLFTTKANRHIVNINRLIEQVVTALITITKTMVSPEEQMRITRSVQGVWLDDDEITLEGNYSITVKSSKLVDMTEGERGQTLLNVAQWLVSLQAIPEYKGRVDVTNVVKEWLDYINVPSNGVIREQPQTEECQQWFEISMMLSGFEMPVEPDDNDAAHIGVGEEYVNMLQEQGRELEPHEVDMFAKHFEAHMRKMQMQQQGAQGVSGLNDTNIARQGAGGNTGGSALTGPVGGNNNIG